MTSTPRTEAPQTGVWHEGHVMGGYLNPACASCRREGARERLTSNPWTRRWPNSEGEGEVYVRLDDALDEAEAATPPALDRETLRLEVRPNEDGSVDEVLIYRGAECVFHLEQMDDDAYWFAWYGDGMDRDRHFDIHRHGKRVTITDREGPLDATPLTENPGTPPSCPGAAEGCVHE
jgi:hypothetical protein